MELIMSGVGLKKDAMFNVFTAIVKKHNGKEERVGVANDNRNRVAVGKAAREYRTLTKSLLSEMLRTKLTKIIDSCASELVDEEIREFLLLMP